MSIFDTIALFIVYFIIMFFAFMIAAGAKKTKHGAIVFAISTYILYTIIYLLMNAPYGDLIYLLFMIITTLVVVIVLRKERDIFAAFPGKTQVPMIPATHPIIHQMVKQLEIPQRFRLYGPYMYLSDDGSLLLYIHPDDPEDPSKFTLSMHKFYWVFHASPTPKDIPVPTLSSNCRIILQHYSGAMILQLWVEKKISELEKELQDVQYRLLKISKEKEPETYAELKYQEMEIKREIEKLREIRKKLSTGIIRVVLLDIWAGPVELTRFDQYTFENHVRYLTSVVQAAETQLYAQATQQGFIVVKALGEKALREVLTFQAGVDIIPGIFEDYLDKAIIKEEITDLSRQLWEKLAEILKSSALGVEQVDLRFTVKPPHEVITSLNECLRKGIIPVAMCIDPATGRILGPEYSVWFDFSDVSKPRHMIIAGGTGTGKSFAAKTIITWLAAFTPIRVFIFDDGTYSGLALPNNSDLFEKYGLPKAGRGFNVKLWIVGENLLLNILRKPKTDKDEILQAEAGALVKRLMGAIGSKSKTLQNALYNAILYYWKKGETPDLDKIIAWINENVQGRSLQTIRNELFSLYAYKIIMHPQGITRFEELFPRDTQIAIFRAEGVSEEIRTLLAEILIEWSREWLKSQGPAKQNRLLLVIDEAFANFKKIMRRLEKWIVEARKFGGIGLFISQRVVGHFPPGVRQQALGYLIVFKGAEKEVAEFGVDKELQEIITNVAKYHGALIISPIGLLQNKVIARFLPPLASHEKAPDELEEKMLGMIFKTEKVPSIETKVIIARGWRAVFKDENKLAYAIDQIAEGIGFRRLAKELGLESPWRVRRWHEGIKKLLQKGYSKKEIIEFLVSNEDIGVTKFIEFAESVPPKDRVNVSLNELYQMRMLKPIRV